MSHALPLNKAQSIIAAAYRAKAIGQPFNLFLTIHWEKAGLSDAQAAKATGDLIKYISDWLRSKGATALWAWVREYSNDQGQEGSHVHIMLHCPLHLPMARYFRRWLRKITGTPYQEGVILTKRIGGTVRAYARSPTAYAQDLDRVIAYFIKGVSPTDAATLGLRHCSNQGAIMGKRAAWSTKLASPHVINQN